MDELQSFVQVHKIDVVLIQETKLVDNNKKKSKTPLIKDWTPIRADREDAEFAGGGLLTYVHRDVAFNTIGHCKKGPLEVLSVAIEQSPNKWWTVNNIYIPEGDADLSIIPPSKLQFMLEISTPTIASGMFANQKTRRESAFLIG